MTKRHLIYTLLLSFVFTACYADKLYDEAMEHYNNGRRYLRESMQGTSGGGKAIANHVHIFGRHSFNVFMGEGRQQC